MTTSNPRPPADRRRAAAILLGFDDDDGYDAVNAVWAEAYPVPERTMGLLAALAYAHLELLHERLGVDATRAMLTARLREAAAEESQQNGNGDG